MNEPTAEEQVEIIEATKEQALIAVKLADCLERLTNNADWKTVIDEAYCKEHAIRLVRQKALPSMDKPELQTAIIKSIDAIGELQQFLFSVERQGMMAKEALHDAELAIEEIYSEAG